MMMKRIPTVSLAVALGLLDAFAVSAQTGRRPVVSPEVTADKRVIFRLVAPEARQVTVAGELDGKPHPDKIYLGGHQTSPGSHWFKLCD